MAATTNGVHDVPPPRRLTPARMRKSPIYRAHFASFDASESDDMSSDLLPTEAVVPKPETYAAPTSSGKVCLALTMQDTVFLGDEGACCGGGTC